MKEIQKEYGFDHIALAIGRVTEKKTTTDKKKARRPVSWWVGDHRLLYVLFLFCASLT